MESTNNIINYKHQYYTNNTGVNSLSGNISHNDYIHSEFELTNKSSDTIKRKPDHVELINTKSTHGSTSSHISHSSSYSSRNNHTRSSNCIDTESK
jgi:hypothetical protein